MHRQYHNKLDNGFNEVDRFLHNSGNNTDFWRLTNSPTYPHGHFPTKDEMLNNTTSNLIYSDRHKDLASVQRIYLASPPHKNVASPNRSILYSENRVCFFVLNFFIIFRQKRRKELIIIIR